MADVKSAMSLGENVKAIMDEKTGLLTLVIDTKKRLRDAKSGKSELVATTSGNKPMACGGKIVYMSLNAFEYKPR